MITTITVSSSSDDECLSLLTVESGTVETGRYSQIPSEITYESNVEDEISEVTYRSGTYYPYLQQSTRRDECMNMLKKLVEEGHLQENEREILERMDLHYGEMFEGNIEMRYRVCFSPNNSTPKEDFLWHLKTVLSRI